jgi:hypothetical protein
MEQSQLETIGGWFAGRLPDGWFTGAPRVTFEEGQVKVVGSLETPALPEGASDAKRAGAEMGRISRFREETRRYRIWIAREAERRFDVLVQWGATCGGTTTVFSPGGSGRRSGEEKGGGEARQVEI